MFSENSFNFFFLSGFNLVRGRTQERAWGSWKTHNFSLIGFSLQSFRSYFSSLCIFQALNFPSVWTFASQWQKWCLVEYISSNVFLILLIYELILAVSTIHSIAQAKNLSITIVSSLSLKRHILQILSLTIFLQPASSLHSPCFIYTASWNFWYTGPLRSPFIIHPARRVVFLKPKLTYLEKQKLAIPWHSACVTPYSTLS